MKHPRLTAVAQFVAAVLLLVAAGMKCAGDPGSVAVFTHLGMEPFGRYLIGLIEMVAALLLMSPFAALGSVLAVGVMRGALIAHLTQLGLEVNGDGGVLAMMLLIVLVCAGYVMVSRHREIPFVGRTL